MSVVRLTTSRPAGYRRGGIVIGNSAAPTLLSSDDLDGMEPGRVLAIVEDANIEIALAVDEDGAKFERLLPDHRRSISEAARLRVSAVKDGSPVAQMLTALDDPGAAAETVPNAQATDQPHSSSAGPEAAKADGGDQTSRDTQRVETGQENPASSTAAVDDEVSSQDGAAVEKAAEEVNGGVEPSPAPVAATDKPAPRKTPRAKGGKSA